MLDAVLMLQERILFKPWTYTRCEDVVDKKTSADVGSVTSFL